MQLSHNCASHPTVVALRFTICVALPTVRSHLCVKANRTTNTALRLLCKPNFFEPARFVAMLARSVCLPIPLLPKIPPESAVCPHSTPTMLFLVYAILYFQILTLQGNGQEHGQIETESTIEDIDGTVSDDPYVAGQNLLAIDNGAKAVSNLGKVPTNPNLNQLNLFMTSWKTTAIFFCL